MKNNSVNIIAIESSCDDTSASIISDGQILSNVTNNQIVHQHYGGVVPELASRKHQENIVPVVERALKIAQIDKKELSAVAFTRGPGLLGSLLVGCSFAKTMALSLNIPLIAVNHMEAHILAHFIENPKPKFPFLCLTVSGGHTQIVLVSNFNKMEVVGKTIDDAAGEAFDKIGKYINLDYPAGPIIDKLSQSGENIFKFAKPKIYGLDFSFSGLKTSVLYYLRKQIKDSPNFIEENLSDICASAQATIVEILIEKLEKAASQFKISEIAIAGGVSANSEFRKILKQKSKEHNWNIFIPQLQYCTDNAAMIAITAHYKFLNNEFSDLDITPEPRLSI